MNSNKKIARYAGLPVEIFWGLWLLPLGLLVIKSGFVPKILGFLLIIACVGYLVDFLTRLLFPEYAGMLSPIVGASKFGELAIIVWLLVMGVKGESPRIENNEVR